MSTFKLIDITNKYTIELSSLEIIPKNSYREFDIKNNQILIVRRNAKGEIQVQQYLHEDYYYWAQSHVIKFTDGYTKV